MSWFKRKNKKEENNLSSEQSSSITPKCSHKWVDFDLYFRFTKNIHHDTYGKEYYTYKWEIVEPYVCCWCKEREDKVLASCEGTNYPGDYEKELTNFLKEYKDHLSPKGLIEDKIQDMLHSIDREYLSIVASMFPERLGLKKEEIQEFLEKTQKEPIYERRIPTLHL